jgi:hypothetical protein
MAWIHALCWDLSIISIPFKAFLMLIIRSLNVKGLFIDIPVSYCIETEKLNRICPFRVENVFKKAGPIIHY